MNWLDNWYKTLADHNTGKCNPDNCRHCKTEKDTNTRLAKAKFNAKILFGELKPTIIATVHASYNGGSDESFVDYVHYYDKNKLEIHHDDLYKIEEQSEPWHSWSKLMSEIAWGVLGYGFGNGDFSISGTIVLNVTEGKLYNHKALIADLEEAA